MDKMTPESLRDAIHQVAGEANAPYTPPHLMQEAREGEFPSPNIPWAAKKMQPLSKQTWEETQGILERAISHLNRSIAAAKSQNEPQAFKEFSKTCLVLSQAAESLGRTPVAVRLLNQAASHFRSEAKDAKVSRR